MTFHFYNQRPAEERADEHEHRKHQHVLHRAFQRDRFDDVGSDEQLEAEQECLSELGLVPAVRIRNPGPVCIRNLTVPWAVATTMINTARLSMASDAPSIHNRFTREIITAGSRVSYAVSAWKRRCDERRIWRRS